ncbi:MAG: hypothetical protein V1676_03610 [Candidatus Diapherotrites archaeon]
MYYYKYYGGWGGCFWDSPEDAREIYRLKGLKTVPLWVGELVSNSIAYFLVELKKGREVEGGVLLSGLERQFREGLEGSKNRALKKDRSKGLILQDHEYSRIVDDDFVKEKLELAKSCLAAFLNSELLREIKASDPKTWRFPKDYDAKGFPVFYFEDTRVFAMFRFGVLSGGNLTLYDWTTSARGESAEEDSVLKNNIFLPFFSKNENLSPAQIELKKVYLKDGFFEEKTFSNSDAAQVKNYMRESIAQMKSMLDEGTKNSASEGKFPKTDNESDCTYCNFKKKCFPGATSEFMGYG